MMSNADLSSLTDDQLIELNHMVVMELETRQHRRRKMALLDFGAGDRVYFSDQEGRRCDGTILRVNQKSLTIKTDRHGTWRVAPSFVQKATGAVEGNSGSAFELLSQDVIDN